MDDTQRTQFDYLLNALERASQADEPAKHGYGAKRKALYAYVRDLEQRASQQQPQASCLPPEMTDEQIDAVTDQQWGKGCQPNQYMAHRAYARAILRARPTTSPQSGETTK